MTEEQIAIIKKARSECHAGMGAAAAATLYALLLDEEKQDQGEPVAWDDHRADEIVTQMYRRFKDWSKRGFSADEVTWCEVKAEINQLITLHAETHPAAPVKQTPLAYLRYHPTGSVTGKPLHQLSFNGSQDAFDGWKIIPLYTTPQQRKPLMLEKFREMEELLDDNPHQHKKMLTDDELKIIMETTMPVIDWKARYGVELNNGERNKWMLEWFIAFAKAIEAAHGIKE